MIASYPLTFMQVLGRAKHEHEFIKENNTWCTIEIELKGEKSNYVIKRKITKKDDKSDVSDWWVNGSCLSRARVH